MRRCFTRLSLPINRMRALVRALRRIADRCGTPQKNRGGKKARAVHARVWYRVRFGAADGVFSQTLQKRISLRKSTGKCSGLDYAQYFLSWSVRIGCSWLSRFNWKRLKRSFLRGNLKRWDWIQC